MKDAKDRYNKILDALEVERTAEEKYFRNLQLKKNLKEKVEAGILWYPVQVVKKYYTIGEYIEIIVERKAINAGTHKFKSGIGCEFFTIKSNGERSSFQGVISFVRKYKMGIIFGGNVDHVDDIEDRFKSGVEMIYDERPYRIMRSAIQAVKSSQEEHIKVLREGIRKKDSFSPYHQQDKNQVQHDPSLNDSQNNAIAGCYESQHLAIIHGPPGTGKTTTLVALIKQLLQKEKRILVCAPSNNAVDLLARQLDQSGVNTLRIGNVTRIGDSIAHLTLADKAANHADWKHIKKVKIEANEAKKQAGTFKRKFGYKERSNRNAMFQESRELRKWARDLEDKLLSSIINGAQAVCTTLIGLSSSHISDLKFDTVVIDEASQSLEAECWNAMLKAKKVIFAGDHLQLPPTVKSSDAKNLGLDITLLDRMTDVIHHSYLLTTQYRMNDKILSFSNKSFYDNKLLSGETVANWSIDDSPLTFIDTSGCGFEEKKNADTLSTFNEGELFVITEWFIRFKDSLPPEISIGIISPYAAQVKIIREKKETEDIYRDLDIEVNTVDGFQGQEKDFIIISLVRSNEKGEIGFVSDERRLNVAMTRAKKKLIIIGDMTTLANHKLFNQLAEHVEETGLYQSAWEYMS